MATVEVRPQQVPPEAVSAKRELSSHVLVGLLVHVLVILLVRIYHILCVSMHKNAYLMLVSWTFSTPAAVEMIRVAEEWPVL